jgi:hypothetical protein
VSFTFAPQKLLGGSYPSSPKIDVTTTVKGVSIDEGQTAEDLSSSITRKVLVNSEASLVSQIFYFSGSITNSGPVPPKAEQKTTYTVVWTINNTSNSISHAQVTATLPPYVTFTNVISSDANVTYNPVGGVVVWNAGSVARGAGFTGKTKSVSFQVAITPSVTQIGQSVDIVSGSTLTATDDFTNMSITASGRPITTRLDDSGASQNSGVVIQ